MIETAVYSQGMEEPAILEAVGSSIGRFLEIGAFNAKVFSNTRALYERGWSGVMIEPSPGPLKGLLQEYGNDERITLISAVVSTQSGLVKLRVTDDGVSTTNDANYQKWASAGGFYGSFWTPAITIPEISLQFGGFEFISIDAEGESVEIFLQCLRAGWRPRCWCVEHDGSTAFVSEAEGAGYIERFRNGENVVLVAR